MGKYKYYKIKTIKDWSGEDWDVYDERKTPSGIMINRGWPYSLTPRDGIGGQFTHILTSEIVEFVKVHSITEVEQQLGLSNSLVAKFRRTLGIQNKFFYRDDQWLLEHQDELLYDDLATLKRKYDLNRHQVYQHKKWLAELIDIPAKKRLRAGRIEVLREQWFNDHKSQMLNMTAQEIVETFHVSLFIAKNAYDRICLERGKNTFSEQFKQEKQDKKQWLLDHQDELLNSGKTVEVLAKQFKKTNGQILRAKAKLREMLKTPKVTDRNAAWLLEHQETLLNPNFSKEELAEKLNIELSQVYRKKGQLKKLLNIPLHVDQVQAWRLRNQEVLLSLHLSIPEIAKMLDRKEKYIVKNRMILREFLNISIEDQKKAWVLEHQQDLEQLSIEKFQEKYQIGRFVVKGYRRLLTELKQNEML
ncbi:MAG: hypothetical protein RR575_03785 [Acinetobacter sp.]